MVLAELGAKLNQAFTKLQSATVIDDETVNEVIRDITNALLQVCFAPSSPEDLTVYLFFF